MNTTDYEWAVIGAGPAGIAAVGKLLDAGIHEKSIAWIDAEFKVGDFGGKWHSVPSNTKVQLFLDFLNDCKAFNYQANAKSFLLQQQNPEETCELKLMAEPLQWVTDHLSQRVDCFYDWANKLNLHRHAWEISLTNQLIRAKNVILAIGSEAKSLELPNLQEIALHDALNPAQLAQCCHADDTVAVFGSSHSAILIIRNLLEKCEVKQVINFFQNPLRFALPMGDWILFDDTGLKGTTAQWAKEHLHGVLPEKLLRIQSNTENLDQYLPKCTKAVYAIGFKSRQLLIENFTGKYNENNGIIAPGLFGLGIAFPEAKIDRYGTLEYRVGLWKFMQYLNSVLPLWLQYKLN